MRTDLNTINNIETMTSREMAELSGKRHDNVLRDIKNILENIDLDVLKFEDIYLDSQNREQTEYKLPRNLVLLVTSKWSDVQRWKIIQKLEEQPQLSEMQLIAQMALNMHEVNVKQAEHEKRLEAIEKKQELQNGTTGYMTVLAYGRWKKINMPLSMSGSIGRKCTKYCKTNGINIGKIPDERFGQVNSYPVEVIEEIINGNV